MPDFYAHYTQGQSVFSLLPDEIVQGISNKNLYDLGLQGPDVLYCYKPLTAKNNPILQLASDVHDTTAMEIINTVLPSVSVKPYTDIYSYFIGFIAHFGLDSTAHPYVNKAEKELNFDHAEIEIEFDKFLLQQQGKNPFRYKAHKSISISYDEAAAPAAIYHAMLSLIHQDEIYHAFKTFRKVKWIFYAPSSLSQEIRFLLMKMLGLYDSLQGHIMKTHSNPKSAITNQKLSALYQISINKTVELITNFHQHLLHRAELHPHFNARFI